MDDNDLTCWTLIEGAAAGRGSDRDDFARRYMSVVRAYLLHRWRRSPLRTEIDDVVQEVFVECFRGGGVLDKLSGADTRPTGFRAFLYGVTRNVAMRCERKIGRLREHEPATGVETHQIPPDDPQLSRVFDRSWARALFREAGARQEETARAAGDEAVKRVELLRLRSREGLPIRDIAARWGAEPARVHKEYARARREFRKALEEVVAFHNPEATAAQIEEKCVELLDLLRE